MGKSALIITLGLSLIIGFIILKLNTNATQGVEATATKFDETHARLIANSGIEIYLEKLKADMSMLDKSFPNNSLFNGTYDITIQGPDSLVKVTSKATFMGVHHTSIVDARADKIPFHPGQSAMYLSSSTVAALKKNAINGSIVISGYDHNLSGDTIPGATSVPGIGVEGEAQKTSVIDMIKANTIDQITGYGTTPSVYVVSDTTDWDSYALEVANNPDIIIDTQDKITKTNAWGTIDNPKVTFINGDIALNNSETASGCGILVINGSLNINGNFSFTGLVIAFKEGNINISLTGNGTILGSFVAAGDKISMEVNSGNFSLLYSTEALSLVSTLIETKRFEILSWWE